MSEETASDRQPLKMKNIGVLDMRKATAASFSRPAVIEDVGMVVYSAASRDLLANATIEDVAAILEAPPIAQLVKGEMTISAAFLTDRSAPLDLAVLGQVVIDDDVTAEALADGLGELAVAGVVVCPERLAGTVQSKLTYHAGAVKTYRGGKRLRLITGKLVLDEAFLRSLPDDSQVVATSAVDAPDILPPELVAQKIGSLEVMGGRVRCRGENAADIQAVLNRTMGASIRAVPVGFTPVRRPLQLNRATLGMLPGRRLYCPETVMVGDDIRAEDLDGALEALVAEDLLICPAGLQTAMSTICNLVDTKAILYDGTLWLIDGVETLRQGRFDYLDGQATLVVTGVLQIDPGVEPATLYERVQAVHNMGVISCTPDQAAALQARLETNEGDFSVSTGRPDGEDDDAGPGMQNIGVLTL